jgi:response regulator of citrate/malate metabolism
MCSGMDDARTRRRAHQLGAAAYLVKPVQQLYLSAAVERCVGNHDTRGDYGSNAVLSIIRTPTAIA